MSDLVRTVAFAFRRKGLDVMPGPDLRLLLAYDLRWFAPEDAKRVVQHAIEKGLLSDKEGALSPTFDVKAVDIPLNFRPTLDVLEEAPAIPTARAPPAPPAPAAPATPAAPAVTQPAVTPPTAPAAPPAARAVDPAVEDERRKRALLIGADVARLIVRRRAGEDVAAEAAALEAARLAK